MKKTGTKLLAMALTLIMLFGLMPAAVFAADVPALTGTADVADIPKYGSVVLSITCEDFKAAGYDNGDVVTVSFLDRSLEIPVCSDFSDVDAGEAALFSREQLGDVYIILAINIGDFATTYGIATKITHDDQTFEWACAEGVENPVSFTISMKEQGGYLEQYQLHQLDFADAREDYPQLSDEQYCNFRAVETTGMGKGVLYRCSSPINPENAERYPYVDEALRAHGVTVVMNLSDDEATARSFEGFEDSYYATTEFIGLNMGMDFAEEDYEQKLAMGLRFLAANPGVYAIHCTMGKDRTGFVAAAIECLMGASYEEVVADYMTTYFNYYGITEEDERYDAILRTNIIKTLSAAFGVDDLESADLAAEAEAYFKSIGLTDEELAALKQNLSAAPAAAPAEKQGKGEPAEPALPEGITARDTSFFTPQFHTDLNYDEIEYETVDPAPLLEEIEALRALAADKANMEEFAARFRALADEYMRAVTMYYMAENRVYADSKDEQAVMDMQTSYMNLLPLEDAFNGLVRDVLSSPCAEVLTAVLSEEDIADYLDYEDMTEEEMALRQQEQALENEYQSKVVELVTAEFNGVTYDDDSALAAYYDGELSYDDYFTVACAIAKEMNAILGPIFIEMVAVRNQIAELKGYDSYAEFAYAETYGRDYTPAESEAFCDAVKEYIIPVYQTYQQLNPGVDLNALPEDVAYSGTGMFDTLFPYFAQLSDELLESAYYTYSHKDYDVDPAPNKTGTAYSSYMPYYGIPFYFNNADGLATDLTTTIHELGHNNEAYWKGEDWNTPSLSYDTAEVHSQGLEALMLRFYPELFGTQADGMEYYVLNSLLYAIVSGCEYDEFQRWAYAEPELTLDKINAKYRLLAEDYGLVSPDDERTELYGWYEVPHNFVSPMYYISYATSAAGAFMFWDESQHDYFTAVDDYLRFTAQSRALGFSDTFEAIGKASPMSEASIAELAQTIYDKLLIIAPFEDVHADEWYAEYVYAMGYYGLMNGVSATSFAPTGTATNEQGMTLLARLEDEREAPEAIYTLDEGVAWAVENGISDGKDRRGALTREAFITMIYRCALRDEVDGGLGGDVDISAFSDAADVAEESVEAMKWAVAAGLVTGYEDGTLLPKTEITRACMAALLYRFIEFVYA